MKKEIKEIINELIDYRSSRTPRKYLKKAYEEIGDKDFVGLIGWILQWQKESFLQIGLRKDPNQFEINDALYSRYIEFFEKCPELLEIFKLEENKITWTESLNEQEKAEIRKYVNEHYQLQFRSRVKRGSDNNNLK